MLERHLDFLTGKSLLLTGAVNDEFLSDLRRQGFNARAWSWYFDYANRENQKQQSAVDFSLEFQRQADLILFYWTKNKQECHFQLMQILAKSPVEQEILIVGENRSGVRSVENMLADFGDIHKIDSARRCSLYHFQLKNPPHFDLNSFWKSYQSPQLADVTVYALPGVFSAAELDGGTALLLSTLKNVSGDVLDIGCGAGVIGLEMGSVWKRLGAQVHILEAAPTFLPAADRQIAKEAFKYFTKEQGLAIDLGVKLNQIIEYKDGVSVEYEVSGSLKTSEAKTGEASAKETKTAQFDKLIVAIGRLPVTQGLGAENVGLAIDERGFIAVDDECRTNLPNVWAIGDVVRGPMLAHKASEEGVAVAERIAGQKPQVDLGNVPFVIYTDPEIAWVGKTEEQLQAAGIAYKKGTSGFGANGRALGLGKAKGMVKVLADAQTDRILGVHMIGAMTSELIAEAVTALEFKASSEDIARIIHAHPTLSEVLHEAALAADKRALHG